MGYEVGALSIDVDSPEGQGLRAVMERDRVTAEEAVRSLLRAASDRNAPKASGGAASYASFFGTAAEGPGSHGSPEAVDAYIAELRDSW